MPFVNNPAINFSLVPSSGFPVAGEHLTYSDTNQINTDTIELNGGVLLRNLVVSIDPYQRFRMRDPKEETIFPPFTINKPITNFGIGRVIRSDHFKFKIGDEIFVNMIGFEAYSVISKEGLEDMMTRVIDNSLGLPIEKWIGAAGMPGMTAFYGLYKIGAPKKGETIFISAASGAVGQIVGQLAKREGLKVIGSCGTDEKVKYLKNELNFDYAFNYKTCKTLDELKKFEPIDIYWDNVGGETLDHFLIVAANWARIVICGMISQYNTNDTPYGIKNLMLTFPKSIKIQGFVIGIPETWKLIENQFFNSIPQWISKGEIKSKEDITNGLENALESLIGIFKGQNFGKAVVQIWDGN